MTTKKLKSAKFAALLKRTAQKLVKNSKKNQEELKKLALTLPLMALLVEEVRAAQKKISIDATSPVGDVFQDEQALVDFIKDQNFDDAQYAELQSELDGINLAINDATQEVAPNDAASASQGAGGVGEEKTFGSNGQVSLAAEQGAVAAESFEIANLVVPVPPAPLIAGLTAFGAVATDLLTSTANDPTVVEATGTYLSTSLKDLQKFGVDFVDPATGQNTLTLALGASDALTSTTGIPLFGDTNNNRAITAAEDAALNVTLTVDSLAQFNEVAKLPGLGALGIDNLQLNLADQVGLNALLADANLATNLTGVRQDGLSVNTIDMATTSAVHISQTQVSALLQEGLHFASNDSVTFDATGTYLSTSLKDLQKLGVDFVDPATGQNTLTLALGASDALTSTTGIPLFGDTNNNRAITAAEDAALNVTLTVDSLAQFNEVAKLPGLGALGIDNLQLNLADQVGLNALLADANRATNLTGVRQDGLSVNTIDMATTSAVHISQTQVSALLQDGLHFASNDSVTFDATGTHLSTSLKDLQKLGVDDVRITGADIVSLDVDGLTVASQGEAITNNVSLEQTFSVLTGIDVLSGAGLTPGTTWGTLIQTLQQAGVGDVEIQTNAGKTVHISDDLSAALYDSGALSALLDANIAIDAGANKVLNSSLKAMADLGVDSINTDHKVHVELGVEGVKTLAELSDLFSAFGLDSAAPDTHLFGAKGAGLVLDQATFDNFSRMDAASVQTLLDRLSKLGFTEIDVMGTNKVEHVYDIKVVAQTPVLSEVQIVGTAAADLAHVFDPDILSKTIK